MSEMTFEQALEMGLTTEARFTKYLAELGHYVIRIFPDAAVKHQGPRVYSNSGNFTAPDLVSVRADGHTFWFDTKAKSVPGYRYLGPNAGWEHGITYKHWLAYGRLAERADVWLIFQEKMTPKSLDLLGDAPVTDGGRRDFSAYRKELVPGPVWRKIRYTKAKEAGRLEKNWHRGPGWLIPLQAMEVFDLEKLLKEAGHE
jgi:hypothetical protein